MDNIKNLEETLYRRGYEAPVFIGRGAFSGVYRIRSRKSGQLLACKVSEVCPMAEREAELLQELVHPLFPRYECHWIEEGALFLVMEYISGSNLQKLVEQRGAFSQQQSVRIGMELAAGLEFLHERSEPIIFRDMKPENVMIRQDGRVKLVDVGCACRTEGNVSKNIAGSRGYAPPEQFSGAESPGRESDVYALGKLLQFLLAGERRNGECMSAAYQMGKGRRISRGLWRVLQQAVQEKRCKRIPDMRLFQQKLVKYSGRNSDGIRFRLKQRKLEQEDADFFYVENVRRGGR